MTSDQPKISGLSIDEMGVSVNRPLTTDDNRLVMRNANAIGLYLFFGINNIQDCMKTAILPYNEFLNRARNQKNLLNNTIITVDQQ